jgi:hypothetical protein
MTKTLGAESPARNRDYLKSHDVVLTAEDIQRFAQWNVEFHLEREEARRDYNAARRRMRALGLID